MTPRFNWKKVLGCKAKVRKIDGLVKKLTTRLGQVFTGRNLEPEKRIQNPEARIQKKDENHLVTSCRFKFLGSGGFP